MHSGANQGAVTDVWRIQDPRSILLPARHSLLQLLGKFLPPVFDRFYRGRVKEAAPMHVTRGVRLLQPAPGQA